MFAAVASLLQVGIKEQEELLKGLEEQRDAALPAIGNLVHDSVPVSDDEVCSVPFVNSGNVGWLVGWGGLGREGRGFGVGWGAMMEDEVASGRADDGEE